MKKSIIWVFALICAMTFLVGCEKQKIAETVSTEAAPLTEEELAYFNGDSFFNGDYLNIRNQFLSSIYDEPADIDLFELFYCGSGSVETITEDELKAVMKINGFTGNIDDLPCGCDKISRSVIDKVLTDFMGITLADTNKIGLDHFVYLSQYDAYYHFHGDTNYRGKINFSKGDREGDIVRLFYNDEFICDGYKVLTLQERNSTYLFVSNQKAESEIVTD